MSFAAVAEAGKETSENTLLLAKHVDTLILDHYLLKSFEGYNWLKELAGKVENRVLCAAEFMGNTPEFLEAQRKALMKKSPYLQAGTKHMHRVKQVFRSILM